MVLLLIFVVLVPRVGGLGINIFFRKARDNRREHPFPCGMAVVLKASSKPLRKDAAEYSGQHFVLALGPGRARRFLSP